MDATLDTTGMYTRFSTEQQAHNTSLATQRSEIQAWARQHLGFEIEHIFEEPGRTGASLSERPVMRHVLELVESGQLRLVVFHSLDRNARDFDILFHIRWVFLQAGALGYCVVEDIEITSKEVSELFPVIMHGLKAQMELGDITRRLQGGRRARVRQGEAACGGKTPYGYRAVKRQMPDGHTGTFYEIDEDEAHTCRLVRDLYLDGLSCGQVAARLNELHIRSRSGGRWWQSGIRKILLSEIRRGVYRWGQYAIPMPRIFDENDARRIDRQLENNSHRYRKVRRYRYLLSGLLRCGRCGYNYAGTASGGKYFSYRCSVRHSPSRYAIQCPDAPPLRAADVEQAIWQHVTDILSTPDRLRELASQQQLYSQAGLIQEVEALSRDMARIEKEIDELIMMRVRGEIRQVDHLNRLLDERQAELDGRRQMHHQYQAQLNRVERYEQEMARTWQELNVWHQALQGDMPFEERQALLRAIIDHIMVVDKNNLKIHYHLMPVSEKHSVKTVGLPLTL